MKQERISSFRLLECLQCGPLMRQLFGEVHILQEVEYKTGRDVESWFWFQGLCWSALGCGSLRTFGVLERVRKGLDPMPSLPIIAFVVQLPSLV